MLTRRDAAKVLALGGAGAAFLRPTAGAEAEPAAATTPARRPLLKPRRLAVGDRLGLVLPASMAFEASAIDWARRQLEAIGFEIVLGEHAYARHGYFAGTDEERAADVNAMFADDSIAGIYCYTGGWGTPRILPHLDYELIRRKPKALIGFSDITALLNAVHQETGLVTFHGPVGRSKIQPWTLEQLRRVVMSTDPIGLLENPPNDSSALVDPDFRILTLTPGTATGRLVGGNLTMLAALMGTPWEVDTDGAILFLEDVDEAFYRVDRMLTQLTLAGKLAGVRGVAFGYCTDCPTKAPSFSFEEILHHHLGRLGVPAFAGLAFGHVKKQLTLPIGMEATIDADAGTLRIDGSAVTA